MDAKFNLARPRMILPLAFALLGLACQMSPTEPGEDGELPSRIMPPPSSTQPIPNYELPAQVWFDRSLGLQLYDSATLAEIATTDIAVFQMRQLLSPEGEAAIGEIRSHNPDIVILGVFQVLSYQELWDDPSHRERFPMSAGFYDLLEPHAARTTTDQIPLMWADSPMITPRAANGGLNEALLMRTVDLIAAAAQAHPSVIDGIFHDYMSSKPWMVETGSEWGEVDFDGDGIGAGDDLDDSDLWVEWQERILEELQLRFGVGFIQVANGHLPHRNATVASRLAGIAYEAFPNLVWGYTDQEGFESMLEHQEPGWLTPRRGQLFSLLWDRSGRNSTFCRTASMLSGVPYCLTDLGSGTRLDPDRVDLGPAAGPMRMEALPDEGTRFERDFDQGTAVLELSPTGETRLSVIETY